MVEDYMKDLNKYRQYILAQQGVGLTLQGFEIHQESLERRRIMVHEESNPCMGIDTSNQVLNLPPKKVKAVTEALYLYPTGRSHIHPELAPPPGGPEKHYFISHGRSEDVYPPPTGTYLTSRKAHTHIYLHPQ